MGNERLLCISERIFVLKNSVGCRTRQYLKEIAKMHTCTSAGLLHPNTQICKVIHVSHLSQKWFLKVPLCYYGPMDM